MEFYAFKGESATRNLRKGKSQKAKIPPTPRLRRAGKSES